MIMNVAMCDDFVPLGRIRSLNIGIGARAAAGDCLPETSPDFNIVFRRAENGRRGAGISACIGTLRSGPSANSYGDGARCDSIHLCPRQSSPVPQPIGLPTAPRRRRPRRQALEVKVK